MSAERNKNEERIYAEALSKPLQERQAYIEQACGDDKELLGRVKALLKARDEAGSFLEVPPFGTNVTLDDSPISEGPGTVIGRYKLLEQIGEGGFGVVYMADQTKPISRRVALKIIKLGMDTKEVIARFEAERQALAMMDHPNIAKVLDAGATDTGRPYFVMELVKGIPITEYCDKNNLDTQQRLELFVDVCKAVQHAHQRGIIHRDIKPSNVLITLHDGKPVPKVIDFGIAKATGQRLTERTLFTRFARMIGTPEYMSPEQAEFSGLDIDARSDIYSLGVLLYQLLTGVTPFDAEKLREAGYGEMQRIIREDEPDKPSTRLNTIGDALTDVAKRRKVSPDLLRKLLRGDLDLIVMKTLEKDRTRRYERAAELAADVQRHLNNEPVLAVAPSVSYRLRKFVRRNRVAVITCSLITAALLVGATIATLTLLSSERLTGRIDRSEFARAVREHLEQLEGEQEAELVWTYPNLSEVMSISPDERYIAFCDQETGDLAIRELEMGKNRRLTHNKVAFEASAGIVRFSPDGKWIAYNWHHDEDDEEKADLRVIGIDGSGLRIIYQPDGEVKRISPCAWFPDGKQILGQMLRDDERRQAVVVSLADGSVRVIEGSDREFGHLSLSPDGRYIAYDFRPNKRSGPEDIAVLPVDGGPEIPVIEHPADDDLLGWAPDGRMLVFRSDRRGQGDDAWLIQFIDGKPQGQPQLLKHFGPSDMVDDGYFTRDGSLYYASAEPGQAEDVYIAALDLETNKVTGPRRASQRHEGETGPCEWSPDGKHLLYLAQFARRLLYRRDARVLVIRSMETGQEREIPVPPDSRSLGYAMPWSPDARSILFARGSWSPPRWGLYRLDVASGKITSIVPPSDGAKFPVGWSADGKRVFFMAANRNPATGKRTRQILAHSLETGREEELYRRDTGLGRVVLSPDRRQLVFGFPSYPSSEGLMVLSTKGGEPRELFRVQEGDIDPDVIVWTPDGRNVLFVRRPRGDLFSSKEKLLQIPAELWRISIEGGEPQRLELAAGVESIVKLSVHPDGERIAFTRREPHDHKLWVLENFLPDLALPLTLTGTDDLKHPFGLTIEVPDPEGDDVKEFAARVRLSGDDDDWNAPQWCDKVHQGKRRSLDGLWESQWNGAGSGHSIAQVKTVGDWIYILDYEGGYSLIKAKRQGNRLAGRYIDVEDPDFDSGPWVGLVVDDERIDGAWTDGSYSGRWDFRRDILPSVELTSPSSNSYFAVGEPVLLKAYVEIAKDVTVHQVEFLIDGSPVGVDTDMPYQFNWECAKQGRYSAMAKVYDSAGETERSLPVDVMVGIRGLSRFVARSEDDAEEYENGIIILESTDLDLMHITSRRYVGNNKRVGTRFADIRIPKEAQIKKAYLQFTVEQVCTEQTNLTIYAELSANAESFTEAEHSISSRKLTKASVKWSPEPWNVLGERSEKQRTPDLSSLIQEVIDQGDWQEGNALVLIITGSSGDRDAISFDGGGRRYAPMLHIEY